MIMIFMDSNSRSTYFGYCQTLQQIVISRNEPLLSVLFIENSHIDRGRPSCLEAPLPDTKSYNAVSVCLFLTYS